MISDFRVTNVHFTAAGPHTSRSGLQGWVSCLLNGRVLLDGITLRRTRGGRLTLSFPHRQDRFGNQHFYYRPLDDAARQMIERQVLQALDTRERSA